MNKKQKSSLMLSNPTHNSKEIESLLNENNTLFDCVDLDNLEEIHKSAIKSKFFTPSVKKPVVTSQCSQLENAFKIPKNTPFKRVHSMEDTLDNFDCTAALMGQTSDFSVRKKATKQDLDDFFDENQFSTQVLNQIDTVLSKNASFKAQLEPTKSLEDLFNDNSIMIQNRQSVELFFDNMEKSIAEGNAQNEIPEEVIEALFATNAPTKSQIERSIPKHSQTGLSGTLVDASFGAAMKQALLANATRNAACTQNLDNTVKDVSYRPLGPFYGLPDSVKGLIKMYKGIDQLYDWQDECLSLPAVEDRRNLIYALPTSGGKTLVAEILMLKEILCFKRNALFVLPFVAIVQEKVWSLSPFAVAMDFLVEEYAASKGCYPPRKRRRKNSIYIATIEKALGLLNSLIETGRISELGLIVIDELHLIGEQGRGATLETFLTKLMFLNANIQIVGMSATIGNVQDLCKFLNADIYSQNFRPVELIEYIKCGNEIAKINNTNDEDKLFTVERVHDFGYSGPLKVIDPDCIGGLVMEIIPDESCLIFCPSKRNCENVASLLCRVVHRKLLDHKLEGKAQIVHALKDESGSLCKILQQSIKYGIAYHHSGLTNEERRIIEDGFRHNIICVICCTSTLAAGVNLPAKRVILRQPYIGRDFISLSRYKQMIGRAGRAGLTGSKTIGDSILICAQRDLPKMKKLLISPMDEALSSLHEGDGKGLRHLLLSCISLGVANTRLELQQVAKKTLLEVQKNNFEVDLKKLTDTVIGDLFKLGALQDNTAKSADLGDFSLKMETSTANSSLSDDIPVANPKKKRKITIRNNTKLVISKLGCAAIKGHFELTRAHMLYDDLYQAQKSLVLLDALHLLYLVTPYDLAEQIRPNKNDYYNIFCSLNANERQTATILGITEAVATKFLSNQTIKTVSERVLNRFYLTLMLYDLWNEVPIFEVSEKFQVNRGVVQTLMTGAATFAANVVSFCDGLDEFWSFAHLLKGMSQRLSHCCVKELLPLMELPAVKQSRAKQLYNAGFKNLQSIAKTTPDILTDSIEFMSRRVANQLIAASKMLLLEKVENLREEAEDVLDGVEKPQFPNQSIIK